MKSMFDNWVGGKVTRREQLLAKMRELKTEGSLIQDCYDALEKMTPADLVDQRIAFNKERKCTLVISKKSAPFLGDVFTRPAGHN